MLKRPVPYLRILAVLGFAGAIGGCGSLVPITRWVRLQPIKAAKPVDAADHYYNTAVAAIEARDYAKALELLQMAKANTGQNIRILNAFGVVYDKLGRFDLSTRYYTEALTIDAQSEVLQNNVAYSRWMQTHQGEEPDLSTPVAINYASTEEPAPPVLRIDGTLSKVPAFSKTAVLKVPKDCGHYVLRIIDGTGATSAAEPIRVALTQKGWRAPGPVSPSAPITAKTTIRYGNESAAEAVALSHTLPGTVRMVACGANCAGIHLTLGVDSTSWKFPTTFRAAQQHGH